MSQQVLPEETSMKCGFVIAVKKWDSAFEVDFSEIMEHFCLIPQNDEFEKFYI